MSFSISVGVLLKRMGLVFNGSGFVSDEPLDAAALRRLAELAARRPLKVNGVAYDEAQLQALADEAERSPIQIPTHAATQNGNAIADSLDGHVSSPKGLETRTLTSRSFADSYLRKINAHAERTFLSRSARAADFATVAREFLRIEEKRLRIAAQLGAGGATLSALRSFAIDAFVRECIAQAARSLAENDSSKSSHSFVVVALGGYGRSELAPFSDIDLLFLHAEKLAPAVREAIERALQTLWDARLDIGSHKHSLSSLLSASRGDVHLSTALMSARRIAGDATLYAQLTQTLERERRRRSRELFASIRSERDARYRKMSASVCVLEPHVKESAGGLRDLHTALWAAHARWGVRAEIFALGELVSSGISNAEELERAARASDFLQRVRFELHHLAGRKTDKLSLDLQPALARSFGYKPTAFLLASEQFMRDYYRRAGELHEFSEGVLARAEETETKSHDASRSFDGSPFQKPFSFVRKLRRTARAPFDSKQKNAEFSFNDQTATDARELFSIRNGQLIFDAPAEIFARAPLLLFEAVALAQASQVPLSRALRAAVRANLDSIDKNLRASREAAETFLRILRYRGRVGFALRLMRDTGLLARYLPEFARITRLIQHDFYHQYTIDEHTLRAVEALDEIENDPTVFSNDPQRVRLARESFDEVKDPALLYLALLLHDIGKGRGRGHIQRGAALAEKVCARLHLEAERTRKLVRLVADHVLMAHLSQRRDLSEPQLIENFKSHIGSLDELNMLFLLTYADMRGVGASHVWNEWKCALLCELYARTRERFAPGDSNKRDDEQRFIEQAIRAFEAQSKDKIEPRADVAREVRAHLSLLPESYATATPPPAVAEHLRMIRALKNADGESNAQTDEESDARANEHSTSRTDEKSTARFISLWRDDAESKSKIDMTPAASELTIVAFDRRGLFADLAGAIAASGVEILSADLHTRRDGVAIDRFALRVASVTGGGAIEPSRRARIERNIEGALDNSLDVAAAVERWRTRHAPRRAPQSKSPLIEPQRRGAKGVSVSCRNDISRAATVIEVHAPDEHGLAYRIAHALASLGLDITRAKIATERSDALDVFYVVEPNDGAPSEKLSDARCAVLKDELARALGG